MSDKEKKLVENGDAMLFTKTQFYMSLVLFCITIGGLLYSATVWKASIDNRCMFYSNALSEQDQRIKYLEQRNVIKHNIIFVMNQNIEKLLKEKGITPVPVPKQLEDEFYSTYSLGK